MVGGADVSLLPIPAGIWMLTDSSLVRNTLGSSGIGKGPKKLRGGQLQFGHAPLAQAHRPMCRMLAFIPWTAGSRIDPIVGWMGISRRVIVFCRGD